MREICRRTHCDEQYKVKEVIRVMNSLKYKPNFWNNINWKVVEIAVFKLQKRIYRANQHGDVICTQARQGVCPRGAV